MRAIQERPARAAIVIFTVVLSACSGGGGGGAGAGSAACDSITGGSSAVTSTGPAVNAGQAADGNLFSYGALQLTAISQSGSIRATAQDGVVFPAGSRVGVFISIVNQGTSNATFIRTYLDGVMVETTPPAGIFDITQGGTPADMYWGFETTAPFDAVEFAETDNGANGTAEYRIYEICSDGHV